MALLIYTMSKYFWQKNSTSLLGNIILEIVNLVNNKWTKLHVLSHIKYSKKAIKSGNDSVQTKDKITWLVVNKGMYNFCMSESR